ncbi:MAG: IS1595 family transposase [Defluviicoccus sp.]|nr:IS1595 family transposase [Defluviicoccus sp.]
MAKAPGRNDRKGVTVVELMRMFPTEEAARKWFEKERWPEGRYCPHCGSTETTENKGSESRPYHCRDCKQHFSVRIGTLMERSRVGLQQWAIAIYLHMTSLKGVSSMKLHRDLGVTQKTAWFMLQRIRKAFDNDDDWPFGGPVEVDETHVGGKRKNKPKAVRKTLTGRGTIDLIPVVGIRDRATKEVRAEVVAGTDKATLQGFVRRNTAPGAKLYTDEAAAYAGMPEFDHESVNHSAGEYVRQQASINGMESFWSVLKRAHKGIYHKFSPKHLHRYVADFAGRHGVRGMDTPEQMGYMVSAMVGKRLTYKALIADNGLASGAGA